MARPLFSEEVGEVSLKEYEVDGYTYQFEEGHQPPTARLVERSEHDEAPSKARMTNNKARTATTK